MSKDRLEMAVPAAASTREWLFKAEGQVFGPVPEAQLVELLFQGRIGGGTEVAGDDGAWRPLAQVPGFLVHLKKAEARARVEAEVTGARKLARRRSALQGTAAAGVVVALVANGGAGAWFLATRRPWERRSSLLDDFGDGIAVGSVRVGGGPRAAADDEIAIPDLAVADARPKRAGAPRPPRAAGGAATGSAVGGELVLAQYDPSRIQQVVARRQGSLAPCLREEASRSSSRARSASASWRGSASGPSTRSRVSGRSCRSRSRSDRADSCFADPVGFKGGGSGGSGGRSPRSRACAAKRSKPGNPTGSPGERFGEREELPPARLSGPRATTARDDRHRREDPVASRGSAVRIHAPERARVRSPVQVVVGGARAHAVRGEAGGALARVGVRELRRVLREGALHPQGDRREAHDELRLHRTARAEPRPREGAAPRSFVRGHRGAVARGGGGAPARGRVARAARRHPRATADPCRAQPAAERALRRGAASGASTRGREAAQARRAGAPALLRVRRRGVRSERRRRAGARPRGGPRRARGRDVRRSADAPRGRAARMRSAGAR